MSSARGGALGDPATKVPSLSSLAHTARAGLFLKGGSCQEGLLVCPATAATASALHVQHVFLKAPKQPLFTQRTLMRACELNPI